MGTLYIYNNRHRHGCTTVQDILTICTVVAIPLIESARGALVNKKGLASGMSCVCKLTTFDSHKQRGYLEFSI